MVTVTYVDTSAAMKLLFEEAESDAALNFFTQGTEQILVASWLLHTELHCAAGRRIDIAPASLSAILGMINLVDVTRGDLITAGAQAPLRSNDAIHLAVAFRLGVDAIISYDHELIDAAARGGLRVLSPGANARS
jgi:predicted nucleic acid-binding protein